MVVVTDDNEMAIEVLKGLPQRFRNLIVALEAPGSWNNSFRVEHVKIRLSQEQ